MQFLRGPTELLQRKSGVRDSPWFSASHMPAFCGTAPSAVFWCGTSDLGIGYIVIRYVRAECDGFASSGGL
jgi:hypothetical protein